MNPVTVRELLEQVKAVKQQAELCSEALHESLAVVDRLGRERDKAEQERDEMLAEQYLKAKASGLDVHSAKMKALLDVKKFTTAYLEKEADYQKARAAKAVAERDHKFWVGHDDTLKSAFHALNRELKLEERPY